MESLWFEATIVASLFALGHILFGHFEELTPKWRKVSKFALFMVGTLLLSYFAGRAWFFGFLAVGFALVIILHAWWLPRQGINGWTAEPKEKYYRLRGWPWPTTGSHSSVPT